MNELLYSSAVLTMSQTTEFIRNKSVDNTILNLIIQRRITEFTLDQAYAAIHGDLPVRKDEIWNSIQRSLSLSIIKSTTENSSDKKNAKFKIQESTIHKINEQCEELKIFLDDAVNELFTGLINNQNKEAYKELLLNVVTKMMSKYGYAYAGQLAGVVAATDFVPLQELKGICKEAIAEYKLPISEDELSNSIGALFDRRDPCLNNLAFSICNRYYITRLIGLDVPIDFISRNLFAGSTIFLDTNIMLGIVYAREKSHNEFREILKKANEIGIKFAVSEISLAELHSKVQVYQTELEIGADIIPDDLLTEVQGQIAEKSERDSSSEAFKVADSIHYVRLNQIGVATQPLTKPNELCSEEEFTKVKSEIAQFDRKYRHGSPAKNEKAIYHDSYMFCLVQKLRQQGENTSAWFLTLDNSVIEHGIFRKTEDGCPYSIRLFSLLQTLSQFVESQALKGEFSDLFGDLVSKDLLPREQLFSIDDLKLLIGFDIRAKEIPPEFVRKATLHIKKNILKGGEITDKNRSEAIHEFTKFLATPEQNFIEIRKKYDNKLRARDEDLKRKEGEIIEIQKKVESKNSEISDLQESVRQLELNNTREKLNRSIDKYETNKRLYVGSEWTNRKRSLVRIRVKYLTFIFFSLAAFTLLFFIEDIGKKFELDFTISPWIKYSIACIIFLIPFVRSFFEHKEVLISFRLWSRNYKENYKDIIDKKSESEFESIHKKPTM